MCVMVRLGAVGRFRNGMFGSVSGGLSGHGGSGELRLDKEGLVS